jgi:hypothetical protein
VADEGSLKIIKNDKIQNIITVFVTLEIGGVGNFLLRNMKTIFLAKSNNSMPDRVA